MKKETERNTTMKKTLIKPGLSEWISITLGSKCLKFASDFNDTHFLTPSIAKYS